MRLAVLNQREGGGATAQARDLMRQAADAGFETAYHPSGDDGDPDALMRKLETFRPDVVHAHCFYNTWPADVLARVSERWPVAFTVHDVYPSNQYGTECWECYLGRGCYACPALPLPKRLYSVYRVRSRRARDRAWRALRAHVVFPTAWMRRRLATTALARLPHAVIPYGIDASAFKPDPDARTALGVGAGEPLVLCVGSMYSAQDDRKGLAVLLDAFARVRREVASARLVIVGTTFGLAAPPGVIILGDVAPADVRRWHAAASVFTLPSLGDHAPLAILEAMASGVPVVATRVGGIPEQVVAGETGILVQPRDPDGLAAALVRLLRDPAFAAGLGAAARARATTVFDPVRAWAAHAALYASLARRV